MSLSSLSKQLSNSLEGIPSIHLDPGDPGSPDPDCSNPEKRPAAAPPVKLGLQKSKSTSGGIFMQILSVIARHAPL